MSMIRLTYLASFSFEICPAVTFIAVYQIIAEPIDTWIGVTFVDVNGAVVAFISGIAHTEIAGDHVYTGAANTRRSNTVIQI